MIPNLFVSSLHVALLGCGLLVSASPLHAGTNQSINGIAFVEDSMTLKINGQQISLWGIDTLAPDQQCWQDGTSWGCGEESLMSLKHFVDGRMVKCEIQQQADKEGPAAAKCARMKAQAQQDIGEYLVSHGWALDRGVASGGAYYASEQEAQSKKRGIWASRFQTAQDWKNGIQRFVGEEDQTAPEDKPASDGE